MCYDVFYLCMHYDTFFLLKRRKIVVILSFVIMTHKALEFKKQCTHWPSRNIFFDKVINSFRLKQLDGSNLTKMSSNLPSLKVIQVLVDISETELTLGLDPNQKYPTLTRDNVETGTKSGDFVVGIDGVNIIGKSIDFINQILNRVRKKGHLLRFITISREFMDHPDLSKLNKVNPLFLIEIDSIVPYSSFHRNPQL